MHWCAACRGRAAQWAYDHADPGELFEVRNGHLTPFSPHAEHYTPMCVPCHKAFDAFALGHAARVGMFDEWLAEQAALDDLTEDELEAVIDAEIDRWTQPKESK